MFLISKGERGIIAASENGPMRFSDHLGERAPRPSIPGELQIRYQGVAKIASVPTGDDQDVHLQGRFHEESLHPGDGLRIGHRAKGTIAEIDRSGNLHVRGRVVGHLDNPAVPGPFVVDNIVYSASGLDYGGVPDLSEYVVFDSPSPHYTSRRVDISDFAFVASYPSWPFTENEAPINGLLRVPRGEGPFPLFLISHGNHTAYENSTTGYTYLLDLLASHGIIAGSIDANFLNGGFGENDARAIVHLEHVKQFELWNGQPGHPLHGKVDLGRVMIAGHSRGGEGVGHASAFNAMSSVVPDPGGPTVPLDGSWGLGPYGFGLRAVVAIAPTDHQYEPVAGPVEVRDDYLIMHGSRDGDVKSFVGHKTYDRAQPIDPSNPTGDAAGRKSLLWVIGANHNQFNSRWASEGSPTLSRPEQERVAKVYLSAVAQARLLDRSRYLHLLRDAGMAQQENWLPAGISLVNQHQDEERRFITHYEEDLNATSLSPPHVGYVDAIDLGVTEFWFDKGSTGILYQETHGAELAWDTAGATYLIRFRPGPLVAGGNHILALRVGQSDDARNIADRVQDFTIVVGDGTQSHGVPASHFGSLPYPVMTGFYGRRTVMQTLRVPLREFLDHGVDVGNIREILFVFDQPISGTAQVRGSLYLDEIQVSR